MRIGNVVRDYAFAQYCEAVPPPDAPPPTGWTFIGEVSSSSPASGALWVASPHRLPSTAKDVRAERIAWTGRQERMLAGFCYPPLASSTAATWGYAPPGVEFSHISPEFTGSNVWETLNYAGAVDAFSPQQPILVLDAPAGASLTVRFYYRPRVAEPEPHEIQPLPTLPPTVPAAPGCPEVSDLQDLANFLCELHDKVDAIDRKIEDLLDSNVPPEYTPDEETRGPAPLDAPISKPASAIGLALTLSLPLGHSRYGSNPGAFPGAGHVILGTADGWLPSIPIRHNPQIVLPLPFQVTQIGLDLAPGVSAEYRWLWPGRPVG